MPFVRGNSAAGLQTKITDTALLRVTPGSTRTCRGRIQPGLPDYSLIIPWVAPFGPAPSRFLPNSRTLGAKPCHCTAHWSLLTVPNRSLTPTVRHSSEPFGLFSALRPLVPLARGLRSSGFARRRSGAGGARARVVIRTPFLPVYTWPRCEPSFRGNTIFSAVLMLVWI